MSSSHQVPAEGWLQWVALCGCYEFCVNTPVDAAEPGNYGKGVLVEEWRSSGEEEEAGRL